MRDTGHEAAFNRAADLAALMFDVPIALISIVGAKEQFFKGAKGLSTPRTSRDVSFCGHAILQHEVMVIEDARRDARFANNPLVSGEPYIRFYAGAPLTLHDGTIPGTVCLIDSRPRKFGERARRELANLARLVVEIIELRLHSIAAEDRHAALTRMQDDFIAVTSHELRTPLTALIGALGLLQARAADGFPAGADRLLKIAHSNAERLGALVNDILDFSKLSSGSARFDADTLAVGELLAEAVQLNCGYAARREVELLVDPVPASLTVVADKHRLMQVLANLISNAVKFSDRHGKVVLRAIAEGEKTKITVVDEGPGIPHEFRARIFTRFAQASVSDERDKGGTGLGLAIVREIVARMDGEVAFDTTLGLGSSFHVFLPHGSG